MIQRLQHCVVRPWGHSDAPSLVRHADDREVWRNLRDGFPHPYTAEAAEAWLAFVAQQDPPTHFAIEVDGQAAGGIGFTLGEGATERTAEIGYWLGRAAWGRGIATEVLRAVTAHAFAEHPLDRLHACVFAWNPASVRVIEKAGYVREGCLPGAATKDGETTDVLLFGILRSEPLARRAADL